MAAIKFLGASVNSFNLNLGWKSQPSEFSVILVEDFKDGDLFNPPAVGTPLLFRAGDNFRFAGLFQSWVKRTSTDGETYEVRIMDPRELLGGVQLILKNYTGHTGGIANLWNIYGNLVNNGFNDFQDGGIPWKEVVNGVNRVSNSRIKYGQYTFNINMSALPGLPSYYRIAGDQISLLDLIAELCDATSQDFYIDMDDINNINIYTVARTVQSIGSAIQQFVDTSEGAVSKEIGEELRLDTVNKFILGGKVRQFYYQASNIYSDQIKNGTVYVPTYNVRTERELLAQGFQADIDNARKQAYAQGYTDAQLETVPDDTVAGRSYLYLLVRSTQVGVNEVDIDDTVAVSSDQNIWPYWGEDYQENLIMGEGYNDDHTFTMNIDELGITFRGQKQYQYVTDVAEIRAAGESRDSWESFISANTTNKFKIVPTGGRVGFIYTKNAAEDDMTTRIRENHVTADGFHPSDGLLTGMNIMPQIRQDIINQWRRHLELSWVDPLNHARGHKEGSTYDEVKDSFYQTNIAGLAIENLFVTYRHSGDYNVHFGKGFVLELDDVLNSDVLGRLLDTTNEFRNLNMAEMILRRPGETTSRRYEREFTIDRLFRRLSDMFSNYYGRQFIVRIPFTVNAVEGDLTKITTTLQPVDSAPIDESTADTAIAYGILPEYYGKFFTEDGKLYAYIKADIALKKVEELDSRGKPQYTYARLDVSEFSDDSYVYSPDGSAIYVKCEVREQLGFVNKNLLYGPRAIIELPSQLKYLEEEVNGGYSGQIEKLLQLVLAQREVVGEEIQENAIENFLNRFGGEALFYGRNAVLAYPTMAAIPLESQVQRYGPFYVTNMPGKVELEIDDNLTPWTYGSYENMYGAGYSKIVDTITSQYSSQTGSVTIPGVPNLNIGNLLVNNGPNVTQISTSFTEGGITTTYRMEVFTNRFGKLAQQYVKLIENQRRAINYLKGREGAKAIFGVKRRIFKEKQIKNVRPHRLLGQTSHAVLGGDVREDGSYDVFSLPHYNFNNTVGAGDYENKAYMSLDGLYVPAAFSPAHSGNLPKVKRVSSSLQESEEGNAHSLNPYHDGDIGGVASIAVGTSASDAKSIDTYGKDIRGIAFKTPMMLSGWGFDINDDPFPYKTIRASSVDSSGVVTSSGNKKVFADGYKTSISGWKTGPLDVRWDEARGVWAANGGGTKYYHVTITAPSATMPVVPSVPNGTQRPMTYDDLYSAMTLNDSGFYVMASGVRIPQYWLANFPDDEEVEEERYVKNVTGNFVPPIGFIAYKVEDDDIYHIENSVSFIR